MRTIKFRGKANDGRWIYGGLVYSDDIEPAIYFEVGNKVYKRMEWAYVDPATVGQFTGFDNCFGSEIYEGDILLYCNNLSKHVVVYHNGSFGINVGEQFIPLSQLYLGSDSCYRVIGNIYDNPELIEKGGEQ